MKRYLQLLVLLLSTLIVHTNDAQNVDHLMCSNYWTKVNFARLGLSLSYFNVAGENDICKADSNDTYPFDERIYIRVYNGFFESSIVEDFEEEKEVLSSADGFMEVDDLGDDAVAVLRVNLGKLDSAIIEVIKGTYSVHIEVNGNISNDSNNRFTQSSVLQLASVIVDALED